MFISPINCDFHLLSYKIMSDINLFIFIIILNIIITYTFISYFMKFIIEFKSFRRIEFTEVTISKRL